MNEAAGSCKHLCSTDLCVGYMMPTQVCTYTLYPGIFQWRLYNQNVFAVITRNGQMYGYALFPSVVSIALPELTNWMLSKNFTYPCLKMMRWRKMTWGRPSSVVFTGWHRYQVIVLCWGWIPEWANRCKRQLSPHAIGSVLLSFKGGTMEVYFDVGLLTFPDGMSGS